MKIALNIFTNSTASSPSTDIIRRTYDSFCDTFGYNYPVTVWCDIHPNIDKFPEYITRLKKIFPEVVTTNSLSDGYSKSVKYTDTEFLFQLEGDWIFNKDLIKHSLEEICDEMEFRGLYHFRFNKRPNVVALWDTELKEFNGNDVVYCETPCLSNNPHIIAVKKYREICLPRLKLESGSKGIEEHLTNKGLTGAIYGGKNYPSCIIHQDGKFSK